MIATCRYARSAKGSLLLRTEYNAIAPASATPEGVQRALYLCDMHIQPSKTGNKLDPEGNHPCLEKLLKVDKQSPHHELYKQRRIPGDRHSRLRNKEFLIKLVLQGEGHLTAIPPAWQVPHDELPQAGSKRSSAEAQSGKEVEDGFNLSDKNRWVRKSLSE